MKKTTLILGLFVIIGASIFTTGTTTYQITSNQTEGVILGYIISDISNKNEKVEHVFIPDAKITIKDGVNNIVDSFQTRLDGGYNSKHLKFGKYKMCVTKTDFSTNCYDVEVKYASNHPGPLKLDYNNENFIWGTVKMNDGASGYYNQQVFGVYIDTKVNVLSQNISYQTRCNIFGYYLIPKIKNLKDGKIIANCQKSEISTNLRGSNRVDLVFKNSNPLINYIIATNEIGKTKLRAKTDETLILNAYTEDKENQHLHYKWIPFGNSTNFTSVDNPQVKWTLPNKKGRYVMNLMVFDDFGGVAYRTFNINAGEGKVPFSGIVSDINGVRIPNALIRINNQFSTNADAKGYFNFEVPENGDERYILSVNSPNFSLFSKVYTNEAIQKEYKLVPTYTQTFNPTEDITITERPDKITLFENKESTRNPAKLFIPKNSIVDSNGKRIITPVNISIRGIDVSKANGQMPGNFNGTKDGKGFRLESFGAVDIQVRDKNNPTIKYNLDRDAKATIEIPILSTQVKTAKEEISLWDYNESSGLWEFIGKAKKEGYVYKATTNKFSVLNADFEFNTGTYIVLKDNPTNSVFTKPGPISIKLFLPLSTGGVQQGFHVIDNLLPADIANGMPVVNLPANTVITVQVISNGNVINTLNVRTGNAIPGSVFCCPPPNPLQPYDPLAEQVLLLPNNLNLSQNQLDQFLTGVLNNSGGPNGLSDANNYYTFIGASNYTKDINGNTVTPHSITFDEWKAKNGFNTDGSGDINSVYYNAGDLDFWRGMHMKTFNGFTSYYVTNFHNDFDAINNTNSIATVCMENSPIVTGAGNVNVTKFYVFNAAGVLVNSANLDGNNAGFDYGIGNGEKLVPGLCITCHGGTNLSYTGNPSFNNSSSFQSYLNTHTDDIPSFLPFDAKSFYYSTATGYTRADQEENIRKLNNSILTVNNTQAIRDFINVSYNNNPGTVNQRYIDNAVVNIGGVANTWNTNTLVNTVNPKNFYIDVVATSCRTCHISRNNPTLTFDTKTKFISRSSSIMGFDVCPVGDSKRMPNSKVTFQNFWTSESPKRYEEIGKFLNNNANSCRYR